MRIAVLSDLHANGRALAAAREKLADVDRVIVLGDLLTYGLDVDEVLDTIESIAHDVILGNHDQLYLDLLLGKTEYFDALPDWIRESVERTASTVDLQKFSTRFAWKTEVDVDGLHFAHANPFGYGDWTYLNAREQIERAASVLRGKGAKAGVFGHNHRALIHRGEDVAIFNPGSLGQPRSRDARSTWLTLDSHTLEAAIEPVDYDVAAHVTALQRAPLTAATRDRLCAFFTARAD